VNEEGVGDRYSVYYQNNNSSVSKNGGWSIAATFDDKGSAERFANDIKNKQEYGEMYVDVYDSEYDIKEDTIREVTPPGMEDFVKSVKDKMVDKYGVGKGTKLAYALAWKRYNNKK
jgi:hypothetical protein